MPVKTPFFSGYLFVGIASDNATWRAIRSTYGVVKLVSFGVEPATTLEEPIGEPGIWCVDENCVRKHVGLLEGDKVELSTHH